MITHVAIVIQGVTHSLPKPNRHHHIIHQIASESGGSVSGKQGFLDDQGNFLDRIEALRHAIACGQITQGKWGGQLYSEDVW